MFSSLRGDGVEGDDGAEPADDEEEDEEEEANPGGVSESALRFFFDLSGVP